MSHELEYKSPCLSTRADLDPTGRVCTALEVSFLTLFRNGVEAGEREPRNVRFKERKFT